MLAFCETVLWRSSFATRCWVTSEATWGIHASHGDGQCWLFLRLLCLGSSRLDTAAQGWLQTLLGSAKRSPRDVGLRRGDIKQPRSQWGWSCLAFCEDVASGYIRGRSQTARRDCAALAAGAGIGPGNARIGPPLFWLSEAVVSDNLI